MHSCKLDKCQRCTRQLIYLIIIESLIFIVLKITLGVASGSRALIAASLYSAQDLIAALVVTMGLTISNKPSDKDHPYGHGKVEYLVVGLISILLLLGVIALTVTAFESFWSTSLPNQTLSENAELWTLLTASICGIVCWYLAGKTRCAANHMNSPVLLSVSQHLDSDIISSIAVAVSVVGIYFGLTFLDHAIAILEIIHIVFLCGYMLITAINGLIDSSVEPELLQSLKQTVETLDPVIQVTRLKAYWAGQALMASLQVKVDEKMKVTAANRLDTEIKELLKKQQSGSYKGVVQVQFVPGSNVQPKQIGKK